MTRQLTTGETRLFFALYLTLATSWVVWTGGVMAGMLLEPRRVVPQPHFQADPPLTTRGKGPDSEILREMTFRAASKCVVPPRLLFRQVRAESGFRPWVVSSSGAVGLLQIKPYHAYWPLDLFDPETNLNLGACLLQRYHTRLLRYGDDRAWSLALAAYHGGENRVVDSEVTKAYVEAVLSGVESDHGGVRAPNRDPDHND